MKDKILGVVYQVESQWFAEIGGKSYAVLGGEKGMCHPKIFRGRDENRTVIIGYIFDNWCHVEDLAYD